MADKEPLLLSSAATAAPQERIEQPLSLRVYTGTALALLDESSVHQLLFRNPERLPRTAGDYEAFGHVLSNPDAALRDYMRSATAVAHIQRVFGDAVAMVPHACHVRPGSVGGNDKWRPVAHEEPRSMTTLSLVTALALRTLFDEIQDDDRRVAARVKEDPPRGVREWMAKTRVKASLEMILDGAMKEKRDGLSLAEIFAGIDNSLFRVNQGDRRFNMVGVRCCDVAQCILLESALGQLDGHFNELLVDDIGVPTTLFFHINPALPCMVSHLNQMETLAKHTLACRCL